MESLVSFIITTLTEEQESRPDPEEEKGWELEEELSTMRWEGREVVEGILELLEVRVFFRQAGVPFTLDDLRSTTIIPTKAKDRRTRLELDLPPPLTQLASDSKTQQPIEVHPQPILLKDLLPPTPSPSHPTAQLFEFPPLPPVFPPSSAQSSQPTLAQLPVEIRVAQQNIRSLSWA